MPRPSKPCTWNGKHYPSLAAAARANFYNRGMISKYIQRGYTCDADVLANDRSGDPIPFTFRGKQYPSISAAARANGLTPHALHGRRRRGTLSKYEGGNTG